MEGRNDWHCDRCGWYTGNGLQEMRQSSNHERVVCKMLKDFQTISEPGLLVLYPNWSGRMYKVPVGESWIIPYGREWQVTTKQLNVFTWQSVNVQGNQISVRKVSNKETYVLVLDDVKMQHVYHRGTLYNHLSTFLVT